ncbi:polysaccharide lyase family 1 protein [Marasmius fiardii PR-910]|nr:polysaccharide lyase family 1 protein [Marasmius fiardii PR-910]
MFLLRIPWLLLAFVCSVAAQDGYASQNGGTTGGTGGITTTVSAAAAFETAIKSDTRKTVFVKGPITLSSHPKVGNNTSIIGVGTSGVINGGGIEINAKSNVIVRNLVFVKVQGNDGITIQHGAHNIWIDHNEFYSDLDHGFDYYDGQVDITHASDYVTVSYNYFHDHYKSSLVGGDPGGRSEDTGKYHLTYHHNYWRNVHTRTPGAVILLSIIFISEGPVNDKLQTAMRFGHVHVYNNFMENVVSQGIHSRSFNQVLIEGNVFVNSTEPVSTYGFVIPDDSPDNPSGDFEPDGFANFGAANDFGGGKNNVTATGNFTSVPYSYSLTPLANVKSVVLDNAGVGKI